MMTLNTNNNNNAMNTGFSLTNDKDFPILGNPEPLPAWTPPAMLPRVPYVRASTYVRPADPPAKEKRAPKRAAKKRPAIQPVVTTQRAPRIVKPITVAAAPVTAAKAQYKPLGRPGQTMITQVRRPVRAIRATHKVITVTMKAKTRKAPLPACVLIPRMFCEDMCLGMPALPASYRKRVSNGVRMLGQPAEGRTLRLPRVAMPRMFMRDSHVKVMHKGRISKHDRTYGLDWQKEQSLALDVQALKMPNISMTTLTTAIANQLKETAVGKQLKWLMIMNMAGTIVSIIALVYSLCTNKSVTSNILSSVALTLQVSTLVLDIYAMLKARKYTAVDISEDTFSKFVEEKLKDVASHVLSTEEESCMGMVSQVDLNSQQSAAALVNEYTKEHVRALNNSKVEAKTGIVLTRFDMPEPGFNLHQYIDDFLALDDTDPTVAFMQAVVDPYREMKPSKSVVCTIPKNVEFGSSGDLFKTILGDEQDLAYRIDQHHEAAGKTMNLTREELEQFKNIPINHKTPSAELFTGGFSLVKAYHLSLLTGVNVVYHLPNRAYLIKHKTKFPAMVPMTEDLIVVGDGEGRCALYKADITKSNTPVTTYTQRVIDVLTNIYQYESEQAYPQADQIEAAMRCIQYVQMQHNSKVGHDVLAGAQVQADVSQHVMKAIRIGIALLAVVLGSVEMFGNNEKGKTMLGRFAAGRNVKKAVLETGNEVVDLTNEVMWELFGIALSPEAVASEQFSKSYDALVEFNTKSHIYYVNNITEYYRASQLCRETRQRLITLSSKPKDSTTGLNSLIRSITVQLDKADEKLTEITRTIKNASTRQQTEAVLVYGANGAGKSTFVTKHLVPSLTQAMNEQERCYMVNFGKNEYWNEYHGQTCGVYDEFMGRLDEDPMIGYMNSLHSSVPFNMEGAFIKDQYTNLKAMVYCSNQPYVNLANKLSAEAIKGFYGRFTAVHFVNVARVANQQRDKIPFVDVTDVATYELRMYEHDIDSSHTYPMMDGHTPGWERHYDGASDSFDDHLFTNASVPELKYRLVTASQLNKIVMKKIEASEKAYKQSRIIQTRNHVMQYLKTSVTAPELETVVKGCSVYGDEADIKAAYDALYQEAHDRLSRTLTGAPFEQAMRDAKFIPRGVTIHNEDLSQDHYVVCMLGTPGTGKSVLAKKLGDMLKRVTQLPIYEVTGNLAKAASVINYPGIVVMHDACYDELEYINFYDTIPRPCLIINTNNCSLSKRTVSAESIRYQSNGIDLDVLTQSDAGFLQRGMRKVINKLLGAATCEVTYISNPSVTEESLQQPGWARRMGVGGALWYGNTSQRRPLTNSLVVQNSVGYRSFIRDEDGTMTETNTSLLADRILLEYASYSSRGGAIEVVECDIQKVNELFAGKTPDVHIKSSDIHGLIKLTRDTMLLSSAALMGALPFGASKTGNVVNVSKRVRTSRFPFSATEYAIDANATLAEAAEIGKKMYRQLMYGSADFTVRVECKDFVICGINQKIYFVVHDGIPESSITLEECKDSVNVQLSELVNNKHLTRTLMTLSNEDFGRWRAIGIDYPKIREHMSHTQAQEFVTVFNAAPMPKGAEASYLKNQYHLNTAETLVQSKLDFAVAKANVIQSYAWSIVAVIIGLIGVGILISAIVKYFTNRTKSRTIEGYITQPNGMETMYTATAHVRINSTKGDDWDNQQTVCITVDCPTITAVDMPTMREALAKAFNVEFNETQTTIETADITIHSNPEKKNANKPTNTKKLDVRNIQSKTSLYETGAKVTKNTKGPRKAQLEMLVHPQCDEQQEVIINKVHGGLFAITNQSSGVTLKGLAWREHYILSSAHIYKNTDDVYTGTHIGTGEMFVLKPVAVCKNEDLIVFRLGDEHVKAPLFPNVTKYFQAEDSRVNCTHVLYRRVVNSSVQDSEGQFISKVHTIDRIGLSTTVRMMVPIVKEASNFYLNTDYYNYVTYTDVSGVIATYGDCGTPVYGLTKGAPVVIGFHFGANGKNQFVTSLTRNQLDDLYSQLSEGQATPTEVHGKLITLLDDDDIFHDAFSTLNYTGPDGEEETVIVPAYTGQIIEDAAECEDDSKYYDCMNGLHTRMLGTSNIGKLSRLNKDRYKPTIYSDAVSEYIPNLTSNSIMDPRKVKDPSNLVCNRRGQPSILMTQMNIFNSEPTSSLETRQGYIAKALPLLKKKYEAFYGHITQRDLTELEMLNGLVINPRDPLFGCLEAVNLDGAVGFDVSRQFPGTTTIRDLVRVSDIKSPTGKQIYVYKDTPAAMYVKSLVAGTRIFWSEGQRCEGVVSDNLKPELLKGEKLETGRTRAFESYPIHVTLATRAVTGTLNATFKKMRATAHGQIGLDRPHFTQLFNRFRQTGVCGEHGDFKNWDKNMTAAEIYAAQELFYVMRYPHENKDTVLDREQLEERMHYKKTVKCILDSVAKSICLADGTLYVKDKGQNSGCGITTMLNCMVNDLRRIGVIIHLVEMHNKRINGDMTQYHAEVVETLSGYNYSELALESFNRNKNLASARLRVTDVLKATDWINCGDDKASVIASEYLWLLNFVTYSKAYSEVWGQTYGSPHKDGTIEIVTPLQCLNFVSRDFVWDDHEKIVWPTLKMSSIDRLFHWTTESSVVQYHANLLASFSELALYPEEVYNRYSTVVSQIINPALTDRFGPKAQWEIPDYSVLRSEFLEASRFTQSDAIVVTARQNDIMSQANILDIMQPQVSRQPAARGPVSIARQSAVLDLNNISIHAGDVIPMEQFQTVLNTLSGLGIVVSGMPAYNWTQSVWSLSCEPKYMNEDGQKSLQRHFAKRNVRYHGYDLVTINVQGMLTTRMQLKLSNIPSACPPGALRVHNDTTMNIKPHGLQEALQQGGTGTVVEGAGKPPTVLMTEKPQTPARTLVDGQSPGLEGKKQFYHKNTFAKSMEFQKANNYKINVGATTNTLIFALKAEDYINPYMRAAIYGDSHVSEAEIEIRCVITTNSGVTGSMVVGSSWDSKTTYTESDINHNTRHYIDLNSDSNFVRKFSIFQDTAVKTKIAISEINGYTPVIVGLVLGDVQSTFDNKALYAQIHVYSRWASLPTTYNTALPSFEAGGGDPSNPEENLANILGGNYKIATDGVLALTQLGADHFAKESYIITQQYAADWYQRGQGEHEEEHTKIFTGMVYTSDEGNVYEVKMATADIKTKSKAEGEGIITLTTSTKLSVPLDCKSKNYYDEPYMTISDPITLPSSNRMIPICARQDYKTYLKWNDKTIGGVTIAAPQEVQATFSTQEDLILEKVSMHADGRLATFKVSDYVQDFDNVIDISASYLTGTDYRYYLNYKTTEMLRMDTNVKYTLVAGMSNIPKEVASLPSGCKRVIAVTSEGIVPSVIPPADDSPTMFGSVDMAAAFARRFGSEKIYELQVMDTVYNQYVANLIYHGPQKIVFIRTAKETDGLYALCKYSASELKVTLVTEITAGATLPTTNVSAGWLDRSSNSYKTKLTRTRAVISMAPHGAAWAQMASGLLAGGGAGLSTFLQNQQMMDMLNARGDLQKELQDIVGEQQMSQIMAQVKAQADLQKAQQQHDLVIKGLRSPAMQSQLSKAETTSQIPATVVPGNTNPNFVPSTDALLNGPVPKGETLMDEPEPAISFAPEGWKETVADAMAAPVAAANAYNDVDFEGDVPTRQQERERWNARMQLGMNDVTDYFDTLNANIDTNSDVEPILRKHVDVDDDLGLQKGLPAPTSRLGAEVSRYFQEKNAQYPDVYAAPLADNLFDGYLTSSSAVRGFTQ